MSANASLNYIEMAVNVGNKECMMKMKTDETNNCEYKSVSSDGAYLDKGDEFGVANTSLAEDVSSITEASDPVSARSSSSNEIDRLIREEIETMEREQKEDEMKAVEHVKDKLLKKEETRVRIIQRPILHVKDDPINTAKPVRILVKPAAPIKSSIEITTSVKNLHRSIAKKGYSNHHPNSKRQLYRNAVQSTLDTPNPRSAVLTETSRITEVQRQKLLNSLQISGDEKIKAPSSPCEIMQSSLFSSTEVDSTSCSSLPSPTLELSPNPILLNSFIQLKEKEYTPNTSDVTEIASTRDNSKINTNNESISSEVNYPHTRITHASREIWRHVQEKKKFKALRRFGRFVRNSFRSVCCFSKNSVQIL